MAPSTRKTKGKTLAKIFDSVCISTVFLVLLSSLISHVMSCMVQHGHFPKKSLAEILYRAEIVVWGKNLRHYMPNPKLPVENSEFQVYCVYKDGGSPISHNITIYDVSPINSCKGESLNQGKEYLISLRRRIQDPGIYEIDSLTENPLQPVSVQNPPVEVLVNASNVCGLQNPQPPSFKKIAGFRPGSDLDVLVHHTESRKCPRNPLKKDQCYRFPSEATSGNSNAGTTSSSNSNNFGTTATRNWVTTPAIKSDIEYKHSQVKDGQNKAHSSFQVSLILSTLLLLTAMYMSSS